MEMVTVSEVDNLYRECIGHELYIYGAKTVAQRTCRFLESKGLNINAYSSAQSVVTKKIDSFSACAGNPAKIIKRNINWDRNR